MRRATNQTGPLYIVLEDFKDYNLEKLVIHQSRTNMGPAHLELHCDEPILKAGLFGIESSRVEKYVVDRASKTKSKGGAGQKELPFCQRCARKYV